MEPSDNLVLKLPFQSMSDGDFIGRASDLDAVHALFSAGDRLVTVFGPAGMGKTRLARRYAEMHGPMCFVDLTECSTFDDVCSTIGRALGVSALPPEGGDATLDALGRALASKNDVMLVLDNCEQIVEPVARAVKSLRSMAKDARFLATSRELLKLAGERTYELPPLTGADGTRLFVERARQVRSDFTLEGDDKIVVDQIVQELDSVPLAIELAAVRMGIMNVRSLQQRLPRRFEVLAGGPRDAQARQKTLRGAIDWSWRLLSKDEQDALAQAAVFRGGFDLEAAEAVIGTPNVLDVLQGLREKSLLRVVPTPGLSGELRYGLYESIRAYAAEKLGDSKDVLARHGAHYVKIGRTLAEGVSTHGGAERNARLALEVENLTAAHARAIDRGDRALAFEAALALQPAMQARPASARLALFDALPEDDADQTIDRALFAEALVARGRVLRVIGRMDDALRDGERAIAIARSCGARKIEGRALAFTGGLRFMRTRLHDARDDYEKALAIHRVTGDRAFESVVLGDLATVHRSLGAQKEALARYEEAIAIADSMGDRRNVGLHRGNVAGLLHAEGRLDEARRQYDEAIAILREVGSFRVLGAIIGNSAALVQEQGDFKGARARLEDALGLFEQIGERPLAAELRGQLGRLSHEQGRLDEAHALYDAAIAGLEEAHDESYAALFRGALGALLAERGEREAARVALDRAEASLQSVEDRALLATVQIHRGHLDLAEGRKDEAKQRVQAVNESKTENVRFALRLLSQALAGGFVHALSPDAFVIAQDGSWFRAPHGDRVDLSKRRSMRAILRALLEHHRSKHQGALPVGTLLEHGWPGERMKASAGANRVYVALSTLRELGLKDAIVSRDEGYLLDPSCKIVVAPER